MRAALVCTGYRDPEQLRIRDESQTTRQKALIHGSKAVPQAPTITIDDKARNAFFSHFVFGFSKAYDVLGTLYGQSSLDRHLAASVDAVSLAFFSFHVNSARASHLAREKYSYALPLLNKALQGPGSAASDSTLLAVLLLDLFEKITNRNPRSAESWMSHVNGALALIKLRDYTKSHNYVSIRLAVRLSTNVLISCVAANAPVPSDLTELRSKLEPLLNNEDPKWLVSGLVVKYADLRGGIQHGCLSSSDILRRATEVDNEFASLAEQIPSRSLYTTTFLEEASERVLEQHFDLYPDHHSAQTWNNLRVMRILLHDIIRSHCTVSAMGSCKEASAFRSSDVATCIIDSLAKDICAALPQCYSHENAPSNSMEYSTLQGVRCYALLFPLYVAGLYASPTANVRPWIIKQMRLMAEEIGIRNAGVVADILEKADGTSPWSVYAILGSYAFAA